MLVITDPASELAHLCEWLLELPRDAATTCDVLAANLGVTADSSEFTDLLGAIQKRLMNLQRLAGDPDLAIKGSLRDEVIHAAARLRIVFSIRSQATQWAAVKDSHVTHQDGFALFRLGMIVRPIYPLRVVTDEQRADLHGRVSEVRLRLAEAALEPWIAGHLMDCLDRLLFVFDKLRFFGHSAAIEELTALEDRFSRVARSMPAAATVVAGMSALVISAIALFHAPVDIREGWGAWESLLTGPSAPKLLGAPKTTLPAIADLSGD